MNKRIKEILKRKEEIRNMLTSEEELDFEALNHELDALETEERSIQQRENIAMRINSGMIEGNPIEPEQRGAQDIGALTWDAAIDTPEYRSAWLNEISGRSTSVEQRNMLESVNAEYRDNFTHNTTNTGILIPKTVAQGIWKRAEDTSALWASANKTFVKGNLSIITGGTSKEAQWYDEATEPDGDKLEFGEIQLSGYELAKAIQVTWKLKKMALDEFEAYIIQEIGERMGQALAYGVYQGKGVETSGSKPEPLGVKTALTKEKNTPQILHAATSGHLSYNDLTGALSKILTTYAPGTVIYASQSTIWNHLANVVDGLGRPLFTPDPMNQGVFRIFGNLVLPDPAIPDGELFIGNLSKGYHANIQEDVTLYTEDHVKKRITDYMGYALVDGKPLDNKAFVILQIGTAKPGAASPTANTGASTVRSV